MFKVIKVGLLVWFVGYVAYRFVTPASNDAPAGDVHILPLMKDRPKEEFDGGTAYYFAREFVKETLKAPSTATFTSPNDDRFTGWNDYGFKQWKVFGRVDCQNSFGAMIRENWQAVVQLNGETPEVLFMRVGEQTVGEMPAVRRGTSRQVSRK
jgi:hypothetical protein